MIVQAIPYPIVRVSSISFVGGYSTTYEGTGATVISLTSLTGGSNSQPSAYDFVVVEFASIDTTNLNMSISGYTEHCDIYEDDVITLNFGVYSKLMGATPDTSFTVSATAISTTVRVLVFRGVDISTQMDVAVTTGSGIDTATATIPAITPSTAGAVVLGMAASSVGNVLDVTTMPNTGSLYTTFLASTQGKLSSCIGFKAWTSGAIGPTNTNGGAGSVACWAALAMALRPGSYSTPLFSSPATISSANGFYGDGDTLSVAYTHTGIDQTIQWKRDGVAIGGATSSTYTLVTADVGAIITVTVTASNPAGSTTSTSLGVGPIVTPTFAPSPITLADASNLTLSDASSLTVNVRTA